MINGFNHKIPQSLRSNTLCAKVLSAGYFCLSFVDSSKKKDLNINIDKYKESGAKFCALQLRLDMMYAYIRNQIDPYEYRCFNFAEKDQEARDTYISTVDLLSHFKGNNVNFLPNDKYRRYLMFKNYFHRDVVYIECVDESKDQVIFNDFRNKHSKAILKPKMGSKGHGVLLVNLSNINNVVELKQYSNGAFLLEDIIVQKEELGRFHPESVNTLRFVSGMSPTGKFSRLYTLFRTGCGSSIVDNVGSGGIISLVDNNGVISTDGMRGGEYFRKHPDSGIVFKGYQIPQWKELSVLVESAHRTLPQQRLLGWDFAWSEKGWDLVEVNPAPSFKSYQILTNTGVMPLLKQCEVL